MRSKLQIFLFCSTLLSIVNCGCPSDWFTKSNPCDTKAAPIKSSKYTSVDIPKGKWKYFHLPLNGFGNTFGLTFKMDDPPLDAYINFQQADQYKLPTDGYYDYTFQADNGDRTIPLAVLTYGMKNRNQGKMLLGIKNSDNIMRTVQIRYYSTGQDEIKNIFNQVIIGIIIVVMTIVVVIFCIGLYIKRLMRRRRAAMGRQEIRLETDAQGVLITEAQNNIKSQDALTLEEFQKYFPKKHFKDLENQFQQAGCSVCLEDFTAETECYQLYCNHIFHEACIQQWLEKQNSCPACRVPLGKKAIEEFIEAQKKQNEVEVITPTAIKIQGPYAYNDQENNQQMQQI